MKRMLQNLPVVVKIALIVILPMCGYLLTSAIIMVHTYGRYGSANDIALLAAINGDISSLVHELQKERGSSSGFLGSKGAKFGDILSRQRQDTDSKKTIYTKTLAALHGHWAGEKLAVPLRQVETGLHNLPSMRDKVQTQQIPAKEAVGFYSGLIKSLLETVAATSHLSDNPRITAQMMAYGNFLQGKERAGIERATMSAVFGGGAFSLESFTTFVQLLAVQEGYFQVFQTEAEPAAQKVFADTMRGPAVEKVAAMRARALAVGLDSSQSFGVDAETWFKSMTEKIDLLKQVDDQLAAAITASATGQVAVARQQLILLVSGFAAILLIGLLLLYSTARSLMQGLKKATHVALDLAEGEGDLTKRMHFKAKDEIGVLGRSIDKLLETLGTMIAQIKDSGGHLGQSGQQLAALAASMTDATSVIQMKAQGVAAAAEEMNSNMTTVAAAVEEAAINIQTVAETSGSIASAGGAISENTKQARAMAGEAVVFSKNSYVQISALGEAAREINRVTETITEISEQTNLLALNATIEAARAGEAGKGFAVVANEIKELAKQTAVATVEITSRIESVQSSTEKTVSEIEHIQTVIGKVDAVVASIAAAVESQTADTNEIARHISQASTGLQEVAQSVAQISAVSGEVAQNIADVSYSSQALADSSAAVRQSSGALNAMTNQLQEITSRFKV